MLLAHMPLLAILSEIPAGTGNAAPSGSAPPGPQQTAQGTPGVAGVNPAGTLPGPQPSPQPASISVEDAMFYVLDPKRPEETRFAGLQLREMAHRGLQVDRLQGELHTTQTAAQNAIQRAEAAEAQLAQIQRQDDVLSTLKNMGMLTGQQANPLPTQQPGQSGLNGVNQQPPVGTAAGLDEWGLPDSNIPGAYGVDPNQPVQQPAPQAQNVAPENAQQLAETLLPLLDRLITAKIGDVNSLIQQQTQAGIQQLRQERATEDQIASTLTNTRQMRGQELLKLGLAADRTKNILDLEDMSRVLEREAEGLIATNTQENIMLAREKLQQSEGLKSQAINDRATAQIDYQQNERTRRFEAQIETDPYAALGVEDTGEVDLNLTDPLKIQEANQGTFSKATELVMARQRQDNAAGVS